MPAKLAVSISAPVFTFQCADHEALHVTGVRKAKVSKYPTALIKNATDLPL